MDKILQITKKILQKYCKSQKENCKNTANHKNNTAKILQKKVQKNDKLNKKQQIKNANTAKKRHRICKKTTIIGTSCTVKCLFFAVLNTAKICNVWVPIVPMNVLNEALVKKQTNVWFRWEIDALSFFGT